MQRDAPASDDEEPPSPPPASAAANGTWGLDQWNATDPPLLLADDETQHNWWFLLVLCFVVAGVLGNVLVCLAICLERRLQNLTNYFLLSLAVADLLVSLVVMPFGIVTGFLGYWPFSAAMCNVYVTCDVLSCSSSIMHMCFISIGRYMGIRNPIKTRITSKKVVMFKMVLVWLLSMVITSPITMLGVFDNDNIQPQPNTCSINNRFFFIFGSLFAFYIPMVFMVVSYVFTVQLLRQQAKFGDNQFTRRLHISSRRSKSPRYSSESFRSVRGSSMMASSSSSSVGGSGGGSSETPIANNGHAFGHHQRHYRSQVCDRGTQTPASIAAHIASQRQRARTLRLGSNVHLNFLSGRRRRSAKATSTMANEQKATKVLGVVFFTFVMCWAPFFVLNIIFAACPTCEVSERIINTCLWLGYVSSTINPIIYTIFNRTFKEAFIKLLSCKCIFPRKQVRTFSATDSLAQTPIKIIGCMRTPTFPFDSQQSISVC